MVTKYPWFESDKEAVCEYTSALGLTVEVGQVSNNNYGEYHVGLGIIKISDELTSQPKKLLATLLHEIGHHYESFLPRERLKASFEDDLLSEYLAGAIGLILLNSLQLEMPVSYYIDCNSSNVRNFFTWAPKTAKTSKGKASIKRRVLSAYDRQITNLKDFFGCSLSLNETRVVL